MYWEMMEDNIIVASQNVSPGTRDLHITNYRKSLTHSYVSVTLNLQIKMSVTPQMDFVAICAQTFPEVTTAHAQTHFTWILKTNEHVKVKQSVVSKN